jgi:hypothetical protein
MEIRHIIPSRRLLDVAQSHFGQHEVQWKAKGWILPVYRDSEMGGGR